MFNNHQIKKLNELSDAVLLLDESVKQLREEVDYLVEILDADD
jgi:uncharacterized coiled-coil protein SlyX